MQTPRYIREAKEFAIDAGWWRKWCDYVNVEFKSLNSILQDDATNCDTFDEKNQKHDNYIKIVGDCDSILVPGDNFEPINLPKTSANLQFTQRDSSLKSSIVSLTSIDESYSNPGKIINKEIVNLSSYINITRLEKYYNLKPNLNEIYDFVKVDSCAWSYFYKWYGCDYQIIT